MCALRVPNSLRAARCRCRCFLVVVLPRGRPRRAAARAVFVLESVLLRLCAMPGDACLCGLLVRCTTRLLVLLCSCGAGGVGVACCVLPARRLRTAHLHANAHVSFCAHRNYKSYDPKVSGLSAPPPDELSEVKLAYQSGQHPELRRAGNGEYKHAPLPGGRASRLLRVCALHRRPHGRDPCSLLPHPCR